MPERRGTVGLIVNPIAGKDIRRLSTGATHTPDTTKMGIVRRVVAAAAESGAATILVADDPHRLGRRAVERLELDPAVTVELLSDHVRGGRGDTIAAAAEMRERGTDVIVALGGDGTCRDVATAWPDAPLIAISTGTNNVFPSPVGGTSAGVAAGLIASGALVLERVSQPTKRIVVTVDQRGERHDDVALVDVALIDNAFVGTRAVTDPTSIVAVIAAIGDPASTGLSSIAGRVHPIDRHTRGGVAITIARRDGDPIARRVRVPLSPGWFDTLDLAEVAPIDDGERVQFTGPGVLAFDGERDLVLTDDAVVTAYVERSGPRLIDVEAAVALGAHHEFFDLPIDDAEPDPDQPSAEPSDNDQPDNDQPHNDQPHNDQEDSNGV